MPSKEPRTDPRCRPIVCTRPRARAATEGRANRRENERSRRDTTAMHLHQSGEPIEGIAQGSSTRDRPPRTSMSKPTSP